VSGFTPSDAAHVVGVQSLWNRKAAIAAAELMARRRTGRGQWLAPDGETLSRRVLALVTRRTAEAVLETAFAEDGLDGPAMVATPIVQRAIDGMDGVATITIAPDRPVIGLGASAGLHYARLPERLGVEVVCPIHADVANALGAVAGTVRVAAVVMVTSPGPDQFRVSAGSSVSDHVSRRGALELARTVAREMALAQAAQAGAHAPDVTLSEVITEVPVENLTLFVEAAITAVATGRPRTARDV
jgi:N-methylhydantoinase A/oxoprolinase/acetone carboxylase beta subunit